MSVTGKPTHRLSFEEVPSENGTLPEIKKGTDADAADMTRMGKKQVLRREFRFISIVGFICILQSTWEGALLSNDQSLYNGGLAGTVWTFIVTWIFTLCMIASMAELASMAPTAGGQYHWVSEFAPPSLEKPLSYMVGWSSWLGWVSGIPSCAQFLAYQVEGLVLINNPDADLGALWQIGLLLFAFLFVTFGFNIFLSHKLPLAEGIILVLHVLAFFAYLIVFWVMADVGSAKNVFTEFSNGGGWSSQGVSCLVGLVTPIWCFIGPDAGAHMSEELRDASRVLPKAMMWATFINGALGCVMIISFCFAAGDNLDGILNTGTGIPVVQLLYNVTNSKAGTSVLIVVLLILQYFSAITTIASSSRQTWAFARDRGFPFSEWLSRVDPRWDVPVNSLLLCLAVSLILGAINFGSETALDAIMSVSNSALLFSYIMCIGCVRLKRWRGQPLLPRRFDLGRWGAPLNDAALAFLVVAFIFSFFPEDVNPDAPDMNWAIVIWGAMWVLAGAYYYFGGSKKYVSPGSLVKNM
ncbi:amino acid transporter [Aureobasidium pullulans]|uniref:Amino acid transporter n=1 Tax=Aureobasidium pullulans TaxID=5580 RepID=A0A4S9E0D4_AURPU|nr:amino acid transporter [Aureobasidium pullulans]THX26793.1 amino acid transporter [Aureobasidium pullulans]THX36663.1 amino acid transporter [Aureobasidium pullulans]THX86219.1 amino acid transporter [Aureobasidium pullulans]